MIKSQKSSQADKGLAQKTQLARAIALGFLLLSNPFVGDVNAAACSPSTGLDISTMGGTNSATISCDADPAPVINAIADQSTFTNSGVIQNTSQNWQFSSLKSSRGIGTFENSGTIGNSAINSGSGLLLDGSSATFSVLSNTQTGILVSLEQRGLYLTNAATITTLNNSGEIKTLGNNDALYLTTAAKITTLNNSGGIKGVGSNGKGINLSNSVVGTLSDIGVLNNLSGATISGGGIGILINQLSSITTLNNTGSIYGSSSTGIRLQSSAGSNMISKIVTLNNTGSIYSTSAGTGETHAAIRVEGEITNLTNSGRIYATSGYGITIKGAITDSDPGDGGVNLSKIGTLTNTGEISGGIYGIYLYENYMSDSSRYPSVLETLNNAQGGNGSTAATTALTYHGALPNRYNIIINSATHYGQLRILNSSYTSSVGTTTFGVSSSSGRISALRYTGVVSGAPSSYFANTTGTFLGVRWDLVETSTSGTWDLVFSSSPYPSVYNGYVTSTNNPAATGAANALGQILNPTGSMATLSSYLDGSATAQQKSNAISQTLPVLVGAAPAATVNTSRNLTQIVQARQSQIAGLSSGEEFVVNKDVWMKGFGVWGKQKDLNGVSGSKLDTTGLALGGDRALSTRANIGGVFAFANSKVNGNNSAAPNNMVIDSYQLGGYGDYAITDQLNYNYQLDVSVNKNKGSRNIIAAGVTASSNYYSYSAHFGSGLKYMMPVVEKLTFIPSARIDYTQVQSRAYSETGADTLNLQTGSQKYEEFLVTADLRLDYEFNEKLKGTVNAGVSYNTMNDQVQITSAYQGGGPSFTTNGMRVSPTLYEGGFGVIGDISKDVELIGRYDAQYRTTGYFSQMASIRVKVNF